MLVIHTLFLHQFRMEYLHEVAEHDVRIHDGRLVIVVTPGCVGTGVVVIHLSILKHRVSVNFGHDAFKSSREFAIPTFSHMSASDASRYASSKSMGIEAFPVFFW